MSNSPPFPKQLDAGWPPDWRSVGVLVAVSGGADSVALLRATAALRSGSGTPGVVIAHFNHHLRGDESVADQQFVEHLCAQLGLDCRIGHSAASAGANGTGEAEAASRAARYAFLRQTAEQAAARYVATAHTADDQAETVLHHILRGTGLAGLAGIPRIRTLGPAATLVRPMLDVRHGDVLDYLAALDQPYRQDRSNDDPRYLRNRIRHQLLPLLAQEYASGVVDSLVRLGALAGDAERVLSLQAAALLDLSIVESTSARVIINCAAARHADRHLVRAMLIELWRRQAWPLGSMNYAGWNALADMVQDSTAGSCKRILPGAISAECRHDRLLLFPSPQPPAGPSAHA